MLDCTMNRLLNSLLNRIMSRLVISLMMGMLCGVFMGLVASPVAWASSNELKGPSTNRTDRTIGTNGTLATNATRATYGTNGNQTDQDVLEDSMRRGGCMLCHRWTRPWIGPSFNEIAQRYRNLQGEQRRLLVARLRNGSVGNHSPIPMAPCDVTRISDEELRAVIDHVLDQGSGSSTSPR